MILQGCSRSSRKACQISPVNRGSTIAFMLLLASVIFSMPTHAEENNLLPLLQTLLGQGENFASTYCSEPSNRQLLNAPTQDECQAIYTRLHATCVALDMDQYQLGKKVPLHDGWQSVHMQEEDIARVNLLIESCILNERQLEL